MTDASRYSYVTCTIPVGQSKSDFQRVAGYRVVGVYCQAGQEGARLRFFLDVKGDDSTGMVLYNDNGEEINVILGTLPSVMMVATGFALNRGAIPPSVRIAVQSISAVATPANQAGADAPVILILEPLPIGLFQE